MESVTSIDTISPITNVHINGTDSVVTTVLPIPPVNMEIIPNSDILPVGALEIELNRIEL
jgi:hypothetical protein